MVRTERHGTVELITLDRPDRRNALDHPTLVAALIHGSVSAPSLESREFLRRGSSDQAGLDELARRVAEKRREILQRNNLDGTLHYVPDERDFVGLKKEERGLVPLRCESEGGFLFINLDLDAKDGEIHWGDGTVESVDLITDDPVPGTGSQRNSRVP